MGMEDEIFQNMTMTGSGVLNHTHEVKQDVAYLTKFVVFVHVFLLFFLCVCKIFNMPSPTFNYMHFTQQQEISANLVEI
jgi:hypothetical protein